MLRDTFAVELLLAGVPLEKVSKLLTHESIKMTEQYYSPWIRRREDQLQDELGEALTSMGAKFQHRWRGISDDGKAHKVPSNSSPRQQ